MSWLQDCGLCFNVTLISTTTESVYSQLLMQVSTETCHRNIYWASWPGSVSVEENDYEFGPFLILTPGKVSSNKMYHWLGPLHSPSYNITNTTLIMSMKKFRHPTTKSRKLIAICVCYFDLWRSFPLTYFQGPHWGKLHAKDPATAIVHTCMSHHVMNRFHSSDVNEDQLPHIECFPDCAIPVIVSALPSFNHFLLM